MSPGEVNSPGLVELPSDSRIADAIKACMILHHLQIN